MPKSYWEYRGVSNAVYAEIIVDDNEANTAGTGETPDHGYVTGTVKDLTGVSEIAKTTDASNEAHYYDNIPAIVISSTGADTITINASGIPLDVVAEITGQHYADGVLVEQERVQKYFAFGYKTKKTDGTDVYVWRLKGTFSIPDVDSATEDAGTDANGQELTYTGVSTAHKFTATGAGAKAVNLDTSVNDDVSEQTFFATVQDPDTLLGN